MRPMSCVTTTVRRSPMSISRISRGDAPHYNGVGSRSALESSTHARNPNYSYARPTGDCCGPVVGLSLTEAHRIAVNIAKLPELSYCANLSQGRGCAAL